jgi:uncharacterized protein (TIGR00369 family)
MTMTGREYMEAIRSGAAPVAPIQDLLGFDLHEVGEGRAVFRCTPGAQHANPLGTVHGGLAMTLIDSACGAAVHSTLTAGAGYTTLETKVNFVRAITPDTGPLLCEGTVVHRGSRVATAEARLTGEADGRLYAHGTSTCMVIEAR